MTYFRSVLASVLCLALPACVAPKDSGQQAVQHGHAVAEKWCSGCHRVSRDQPPFAQAAQARPAWAKGPSFMEVAENPRVDRDYLRGLASEFFFPMPAFHLEKQDQEDVISYILSLKGQL